MWRAPTMYTNGKSGDPWFVLSLLSPSSSKVLALRISALEDRAHAFPTLHYLPRVWWPNINDQSVEDQSSTLSKAPTSCRNWFLFRRASSFLPTCAAW